MFFGIINGYTSVLNTAIPFTTKLNTNNKTSNSNGVISLNKSGYYNVDCNLSVTGIVGDIIATVYADGVATDITSECTLSATTDYAVLSISDAIKVLLSQNPSIANISIVLNTAGVTVNGTLRVEYLQ